jgi:hypothetical protein
MNVVSYAFDVTFFEPTQGESMSIRRVVSGVVLCLAVAISGLVVGTGSASAADRQEAIAVSDQSAAAVCVASFGAGTPQFASGRVYGLAYATNCHPPAYAKVCAQLWQIVIVSVFPPITVKVRRDTTCTPLYSMSAVRIFASYPCQFGVFYTQAFVYNSSGGIIGIKTSKSASTGC